MDDRPRIAGQPAVAGGDDDPLDLLTERAPNVGDRRRGGAGGGLDPAQEVQAARRRLIERERRDRVMIGDVLAVERLDCSRRYSAAGRDLTRGASGGEQRLAVEPFGRGVADRLAANDPHPDPGIDRGPAVDNAVFNREGAESRVLRVEVGVVSAMGERRL